MKREMTQLQGLRAGNRAECSGTILSARLRGLARQLLSVASSFGISSIALLLVPGLEVHAQSDRDFFETRVRPLLSTNCVECHDQETDKGGLIVSTREALLKGGYSGPAIVPGAPDDSLLLQAMRHDDPDLQMPWGEPKLSAREIEGIAKWIKDGAYWPEDAPEIVFDSGAELQGLSPSAELFVHDVRPVLEQTCFACHADDERSGLRLDSRERMLAGGKRGPAILPGNPEQSLLIAALRHEQDDLHMPQGQPKLDESKIEAFAEWIRTGAEWAEGSGPINLASRGVSDEERAFWSFQALVEPPLPEASSTEWGATDLDRFVARMHEREGVQPVERASKRVLIRRATFDLTGLPPTPEEVTAFIDDDSPGAFAGVIERLLASKHYGERWARHWLDVTRYGEDDTRGLAEDKSGREIYKMAYVHRDWVVQAFNDDMPYDTFVKAQLVADQMPIEVRKELLPGLGFLGQGPWYFDLANPAVARADERHDRVDVTSRAFLGLTVGCARCHDHKYDPIGTNDYYSLAGIFNNTNYNEYPIASEAVAARFIVEKKFIKQLEDDLKTFLETEGKQLAQIRTSQASRYMLAAWRVAGKQQLPSEKAALTARLDLETLERWVEFLDDEPKHYPFLKAWQLLLADEKATEERAKELAAAFQRLLQDVLTEQEKLEERNRRIIAKGMPLDEVKSTPMPNGFESFFDLHQLELETMERSRQNLFIDVYKDDLDNEIDTFFPKPALLVFSEWDLERQLSHAASDHVAAMRAEIKERKAALPDIPVVMGVKDKDAEDIGNIPLHIRGSPENLGSEVTRAFIEVLSDEQSAPYSGGSGRMQLARDIVAHPITARVIVNRVWSWHMGSGIVQTPSNFGFAGAPPTHPELLEFLTARFVANGMRIKALHREIMLSAVYQLAVGDDETNQVLDPDSRFLWRFQRRRMQAEEIRDALLSVSGELDLEIGGPSLDLADEDNERRTIYGMVSRFLPDEFLRSFDFPSPSLSAEQRFSTNTPLQALYFMNSPFVQNRAEAFVRRLAKETSPTLDPQGTAKNENKDQLAKRIKGAAGSKQEESKPEPPEIFDDRAMIQRAYALLHTREASHDELALGLALLAEQRKSWRASAAKQSAAAALSISSEALAASHNTATWKLETPAQGNAKGAGASVPQDSELDAAKKTANTADLAKRQASMNAWVQYARALLSTVEFRFID
ncbi:MAG: mono/diheme cytochrome c family protein [Chlamydiales bacterium]|jgi:mono/diheme cytochrome c family protein